MERVECCHRVIAPAHCGFLLYTHTRHLPLTQRFDLYYVRLQPQLLTLATQHLYLRLCAFVVQRQRVCSHRCTIDWSLTASSTALPRYGQRPLR